MRTRERYNVIKSLHQTTLSLPPFSRDKEQPSSLLLAVRTYRIEENDPSRWISCFSSFRLLQPLDTYTYQRNVNEPKARKTENVISTIEDDDQILPTTILTDSSLYV